MFITNGVKASTTTQETYEEERRSHGLIYSGIYNSNSGINDLNQFIMAEKITKDLNPTYGSIQKLFQRRISLIAFCEDRVIQITSNKDAIYNADGNPQLISSSNVLGDANPFVGNFGISKNPESFASESYRAYFTDKARGAVLRLSKDGLTPISKTGMHDWFRDNLPIYTSLIGTYDSYKENYNITLSNTYTENIIFNTSFGQGLSSTEVDVLNLNVIENGGVYSGDSYTPSLNTINFPDDSTFNFGNSSSVFKNTVTVTNHAEIPFQYFQEGTDQPDEIIATENIDQAAQAFQQATYQVTPGSDNGWWYDPRFTQASSDLFGGSATTYADAEVFSVIKRVINGVTIDESDTSNSPLSWPMAQDGYASNSGTWPGNYDPEVEKYLHVSGSTGGYMPARKISRCITRTNYHSSYGGTDKAIVFDRPNPSNSYVEFKNIGNNSPDHADHPSLFNYNNAPGTPGDADHSSFFNGDEIHIQVTLECYRTYGPNQMYQLDLEKKGYNYIKPKIELYDGNVAVPADKLHGLNMYFLGHLQSNQATQDDYQWQQTTPGDMGGDFYDQAGQNDNSYVADGSVEKCIKLGTQSSPTVTFPNTSAITALGPSGSGGTQTVTIGASFKFKDNAQQDVNGQYTGTGDGIEEETVINDLRIRIDNAEPAVTSGDDDLERISSTHPTVNTGH